MEVEKRSDVDIFIDYVPLYKKASKALIMFIYHFLIFLALITTFLFIASKIWYVAIPLALIGTCLANIPFIYMFVNYQKIREKYTKSNLKHPWQKFWLHYSYSSPSGAAALYFIFFLKTDYFLPSIIDYPTNIFTKTLFPIYIAIPIGIIIVIYSWLIIRKSQNFDGDTGNYLHLIDPNKNRVLKDGLYKYMRHPRFFTRFTIAIGLGFLANNLLAIFVALFQFIPYFSCVIVLDKKLGVIFGDEVKKYIRVTPSFIPKFRNWKDYVKVLFSKN